MPFTLAAYRVANHALSPFVGAWLEMRGKNGKEDPARLQERFGHASATRPDGELIWLHGANVFGVFLLRQHFQTIPKELEEAAIVDGAGRFRLYWQICLPLVSSAMVALAIFTFLGNWNDLFWPLVILSDRNTLTLPVGLQVLGGGNYVQRGVTMAAAALASTPPLILYIIFQRRIIAGITLTGMGGR